MGKVAEDLPLRRQSPYESILKSIATSVPSFAYEIRKTEIETYPFHFERTLRRTAGRLRRDLVAVGGVGVARSERIFADLILQFRKPSGEPGVADRVFGSGFQQHQRLDRRYSGVEDVELRGKGGRTVHLPIGRHESKRDCRWRGGDGGADGRGHRNGLFHHAIDDECDGG